MSEQEKMRRERESRHEKEISRERDEKGERTELIHRQVQRLDSAVAFTGVAQRFAPPARETMSGTGIWGGGGGGGRCGVGGGVVEREVWGEGDGWCGGGSA